MSPQVATTTKSEMGRTDTRESSGEFGQGCLLKMIQKGSVPF